MQRKSRSISVPIVLASVAVALAVTMLVGWTILIVGYLPVAPNVWLLVAGIGSFVFIMSVQIMFSVFLVREILETRRQYRFIDSVTHELKSPLASLRLCLETLERPELSDAQRHSLHSMMANDVDRLSDFIDDVLQASRLAHGRRDGVPVRSLNLHHIVQHATEAVARRHQLDPATIELDIDPELELVSEETSLDTILKNLLDNAIKYSDAPLHIAVRARVDGTRVAIEVSDRGIGIPPAALRHIFKRFYRVESEAVRQRRGTGLGLFVVHALVRYLGGKLEAHSAGEGLGTTMRLELPLDGSDSEAGRAFARLRELRQ